MNGEINMRFRVIENRLGGCPIFQPQRTLVHAEDWRSFDYGGDDSRALTFSTYSAAVDYLRNYNIDFKFKAIIHEVEFA